MPTLHTPLCDLIGIEYPIIQAPMAGGPATPDLVAAVSAAGALGSFGHAYTAPDAMRAEAATARARTARPFNLNLFTAPVPASRRPRRSGPRSRPSGRSSRSMACPCRSACRRRTRPTSRRSSRRSAI
jgi:NAD(P)H-dependent flavin oxidoreductase YrpB (nitropropane dioxygenase family)